MDRSQKEVQLRKRRRDYAVDKPKNAIRAGTTVVKVMQQKVERPERILAKKQMSASDKRKFEINSKRKESANFPQPPETAKSALVVRLTPKSEPLYFKCRDIFTEFNLLDQFEARFIALTEENRQKLKSISHIITYGTPTPELTRKLVHTHLHTEVDGKRVPVTSNKVVKQALSGSGFVCIDDLSHALLTGENVEPACSFIAPFHFVKKDLNEKSKQNVKVGGESGWRGAEITSFVESII